VRADIGRDVKMTPKIQAAIRQFEEIFQGEETTLQWYNPEKKVFLLVVPGEKAEHYRKVVQAVQELVSAETLAATKRLAEAINREHEAGK
jgi:hypothetical protein